MKVLHFYKSYYPESLGGVEQVIFQLASGSVKLGIDSTVLSLAPGNIERVVEVNGHKSYRCRSDFKIASTNFSFSVLRQFKELAKQVDIIHYHFPWPFMDLLHFAANHKKPSVLTYHSDIIRQKILLKFYRPLMNKFFESIDSIVATSPNYQISSSFLQRYQSKVEVIPIGLDRDLYSKIGIERSQYWRERLGNKFFLFVGVLRYYKGLHILLDALARGDFPMVIVGSGPIESELRVKAASLGLKNTVFLGQINDDDKDAILNLSYAVVFPSNLRSEAFGISLLEGAMYGKPMISSEIGTGTSFVNCNQQTGIVIPPSSPKDLHVAMTYLWNNPDVAAMMGLNAADRYEKLFTADRMCQAYAALYRRLIDEKSK